ncbi:hypothetical protein PHLCEN_2v8029 [Hermanssonia centrifuga]|uniref:Uncharacterized protein n=1 Tax=Hermanssonia centrifuga TaxID=98765 RepID=A0A2R6NVE9_9APHY|nr:hypothetical protein PHLCEN_2v8029 [Hermanssonia centrifuga]
MPTSRSYRSPPGTEIDRAFSPTYDYPKPRSHHIIHSGTYVVAKGSQDPSVFWLSSQTEKALEGCIALKHWSRVMVWKKHSILIFSTHVISNGHYLTVTHGNLCLD